MTEISKNKLTDSELQISKTKFWSRMGLIFSILSTISTLLFLNIGGAPLSIFLAIFALSFVKISKDTSGKLNKKNVVSILLSIWGILLGLILFALLVFTAYKLQDPKIGNETLQRMRTITDLLNQYYNIDLKDFY